MHQILDSLKNTPHEWIRQLLFFFNSGDIDGFTQSTANTPFAKQVKEIELFKLFFICLV